MECQDAIYYETHWLSTIFPIQDSFIHFLFQIQLAAQSLIMWHYKWYKKS